MRLLVIEDEKDLNRLIVDRLLQDGYAVDFCYDGVSAVDYIKFGNYDASQWLRITLPDTR